MTFEEQATRMSQGEIVSLLIERDQLRQQVDWFKRQLFGSSSERRVPDPGGRQLTLGETPPAEETSSAETSVAAHHRRRPRAKLDDTPDEGDIRFGPDVPIERIDIPSNIPATERGDYEVVSEKITRRLAQRLGVYVVLEYRRPVLRTRHTLDVPTAANAVWSLDFMSDCLYSGRRFRVLNVLDEGVREGLDIVVDTSIPADRVVRTMEQISRWRGLPHAIRCDNGPELTSELFAQWCKDNNITILYIEPGKPSQNAYIERFNRTYREEVLDPNLFDQVPQVREMSYRWLDTYNEVRPHDALGRIPPTMFRRRLEKAEVSTSELST
jgi:putative transposase